MSNPTSNPLNLFQTWHDVPPNAGIRYEQPAGSGAHHTGFNTAPGAKSVKTQPICTPFTTTTALASTTTPIVSTATPCAGLNASGGHVLQALKTDCAPCMHITTSSSCKTEAGRSSNNLLLGPWTWGGDQESRGSPYGCMYFSTGSNATLKNYVAFNTWKQGYANKVSRLPFLLSDLLPSSDVEFSSTS